MWNLVYATRSFRARIGTKECTCPAPRECVERRHFPKFLQGAMESSAADILQGDIQVSSRRERSHPAILVKEGSQGRRRKLWYGSLSEHARRIPEHDSDNRCMLPNNMEIVHVLSDLSQPHPKTISVAVKELKSGITGIIVQEEWNRECAAHQALDVLNREHLVQAIAAYRQGDDHCLLFEWADGGNLRSYWNTTEYTGLTHKTILEHLIQLRGLTDALRTMHNPKDGRSRNSNQSQRERLGSANSFSSASPALRAELSPGPEIGRSSNWREEHHQTPGLDDQVHTPQISVQYLSEAPRMNIGEESEDFVPTRRQGTTAEYENWRHGDIKPENILRFTGGQPTLGTLKLADLGRAKQHFEATSQRLEHERDAWRTKPYEPPDLYIDQESSMSRLFDVWSLGCVFFECIVWLLYGQQWLQKFVRTLQSDNQDATPFWVRNGDSATISPTILASVEHMLGKDPECYRGRPSALRDLLILVWKKMLVIDLPDDTDEEYTDGNRANTQIIIIELDHIIQKSRRDQSYLFTGADRSASNIQPLPEPIRPLPRADDAASNPVRRQFGDSLNVPPRQWNPFTYSGVPTNKWMYQNDDTFAQKVYRKNSGAFDVECMQLDNDLLCKTCQNVKFSNGDLSGMTKARKVQTLKKNCCFCAMLRNRVHAAGLNEAALISLSWNEAGLIIKSKEGMSGRNAQLRLCRSPGQSIPARLVSSTNRTAEGMPATLQSVSFIPVGLPRLPKIGSEAYFTILRCRLNDCDKGHGQKGLECTSLRSSR